MSNSRRASRPTTKKKNVISPLLTHSRRSWEISQSPRLIDSFVPHSDSYEDAWTFAHTSAANAAASRTAAPPVSVRRKSRSGVDKFRAHAVFPEKGPVASRRVMSALLRGHSSPRPPSGGDHRTPFAVLRLGHFLARAGARPASGCHR